MRKLFLLVVIVMAAITASAQEGIYLGGGISLWRNNDVDKTSFSITPDVGYNLSEKWAVGVELAYAHKGYDGEDAISTNAFALAPYARNHSIFRHDNFIGCFSADKIKISVRKYFCFNIPIDKNMAEGLFCRSPYHEEYIQTSASGNPEDLCH